MDNNIQNPYTKILPEEITSQSNRELTTAERIWEEGFRVGEKGEKKVVEWLQRYMIPFSKEGRLIQVRNLEADLKMFFKSEGIE